MAPEATRAPLLPHTCACGARWGGANTSHCGRCHITCSGVTSFDAHRRAGECLPPEAAGLILVGGRHYECWGQPSRWGDEE